MKVAKWGNSLAIRIPADVAQALGIKEGDDISLCDLTDEQYGVIIDQRLRKAAVERLRSFAGKMPADFKFDREEANARGV